MQKSAAEQIDDRIVGLADWRGEILGTVRKLILEADPEVVEEIKWRKPSNAMLGVPVWSHDGIICTGETYKDKVKLTFANGASLADPDKLFNASLGGNARRAIDVHEGEKVKARAFKALIRAAVKLNSALACAFLLVAVTTAPAARAEPDADFVARANAFVDAWHADAAHARLAYFDKIAPDGVYIGTDKTERWTRDAFKAWAARFFERPSAWSFTPLHRNVRLTPDHSLIWFDEQLESTMGVLQATGVMRMAGDTFEIVHYQLSIAVPNEVQPQVSALIKEFEAR